MADITISYEDGLRLSELHGQLAQIDYQLAHWVPTHLVDIISIIILVAFVMGAVAFIYAFLIADDYGCVSPKYLKVGVEAIAVAFVIITVIGIYAYYVSSIADLNAQEANIQTQIDIIMLKYA